ncbi:hypothetical protein VH567_00070 [Sphingomonas sp. 4RDLI-65]|uniref:hypothetical protein n=1 Tax=Sphingomonas sp. 4RDLI-65 TaxID=3111641 RepID=UPI003C237221
MAREDPAGWTSPHALAPQALAEVRPQVRDLLTAVPAFGVLPAGEQQQLARDMVKVLSYIADPNAVSQAASQAGVAPPPPPTSTAMDQASGVANFKKLTSGLPPAAGANFKAGATAAGVEQFGNLVGKVDFPKFVGGLIKNVFQAIVESSMEQMRAYGELIANVAKTVDQFMDDNIGAGAGRDYLANRFPDDLSVEVDGNATSFAAGDAPPPTAKLVTTGDDTEVALARISAEMNINPPITDLSDANAELRLVTAARLQMARQRQQLLSSMVMLGINRIVITDGSINAKVVFDMRASDSVQQSNTASMYDRESSMNRNVTSAGVAGWGFAAGTTNTNVQEHVATVGSAVDESSESKAEVKAKLSGDVRVNFKSDYLPLEKMATPEMMSVIQGNSTPYNPNTPKAPAAPAAAR